MVATLRHEYSQLRTLVLCQAGCVVTEPRNFLTRVCYVNFEIFSTLAELVSIILVRHEEAATPGWLGRRGACPACWFAKLAGKYFYKASATRACGCILMRLITYLALLGALYFISFSIAASHHWFMAAAKQCYYANLHSS